MIGAHLERAGYGVQALRVETAAATRDALNATEWDLVLCDYSLPGFDALDALAVMRDLGLSTPVIVISGTIGEETAVEVMRAGASDYLMKGNLARLGPIIERELTEAQNRKARYRAEAERRASDERYRTLFDYAPDGIVIADAKSYYLDANASMCRMLGYTRDEIIGMHASDIVVPEEIPNIGTALNVIKSASEYQREWQFRRRDGSTFPAEVIATLMPDGNLLGMIRDITELRKSEAQYRRLLETTYEGVWISSPEAQTTYVNHRMAEMIGLEPQDMIGKFSWDFVADVSRTEVEARWKQRNRGARDQYDLCLRHRDGSTVWTIVSATPVYGDQGEFSGSLCMLTDITGRKRIEQELAKSGEQLRDLIDNARDIIYTHDLEGNYTSVNRAAEEITGYSREESLRMNLAQTVVPEYLERARQMIKRKIAGGQVTAYELEIVAKDGHHVTVEVNTRIIRENGIPTGVQGIARDVTERKRAEESRREADERYRLLFDRNPVPLWVYDQETLAFLAVNDAAIHHYGYSREEFQAKTIKDIRPPEELLTFEDDLKIRSSTFREAGIWRHQKKDGSIIEVEITSHALTFAGRPAKVILANDVTERGRVEAALRESEDRYRDLVENSHDLICTHTLDGRVLSVNNSVVKVLGFGREQIIGGNVRTILLPEYRTGFDQYIADLLEHGVAHGTMSVRTKSGDVRLWEFTNTLRTEGSPFPIVRGMAHDVTEHRKAEAAQKQSEIYFRSLIENSTDVISIFDAQGVRQYTSPSIERVLGFRPEEVVGRSGFDLLHPDDQLNVKKLLYHDLQIPGAIAATLFRIRHLDGSWRVMEGVASNLLADPAVAGIVLNSRDITDRKQAEEEIGRLHEQHSLILNSAAEGIYGLDRNGITTFVNLAAAKMVGWEPGELIGWPLHDVIHHSKPDGTPLPVEDCPILQTIADGRSRRVSNEYYWRKDRSHFPVEYTSTPILENGRVVGAVGTFTDITERIAVQEALHSSEAQLRQAQKMEAIGQLAGGIAHDFNNLLTVISGYSDLSIRKLPPEDPIRKNLDEIGRASERAAGLTRQLLAFSRKQVLQPRVISLNSVVSELDKMLPRLIGEDVELRTMLDPGVGNVKADPGQLEQVLMNLAVNARDAMPGGGKLTIETANVQLDENFASQHVSFLPGNYVRLAVSDTGTGMDAETQARIFEPFFTTKESGKGTGLGLAMVYGIVKQSGGYIYVYSEVGHGTTFKIYLPRVTADEQRYEQSKTAPDDLTGSETVLLVEDDEMLRRLTVEILGLCGYQVLSAENGAAAISLCESHSGPIDLLVTDMVMPGMSGRDVAERLTAMRPGLKVLFISGYTDKAISHKGVLDPGVNFLQKPFSPDTLARKVREVLRVK